MKSILSFTPVARRWLALCGAAVAVTFAPAARAVSEPSPLTGEKRSYQYSWEQEKQLGAEADQEITQQMGLYDNAEIQAYVQQLGQRVLETSTFRDPATPEMYRDTKFTFRVLDSSVVNAFALPGGYVYVTRGLLSHVDNEAQLAVVLGHEIAHVAARHSSLQARRSMWGQLGVIAGAILGQQILGERMPDIGSTILQTGGPAMQTFLLKYSREAEHEADTYGVHYAARSGFAAGDSARFFNSLHRLSAAESDGKNLPAWQSSHPDPGDRASRVRELAANTAPGATYTGEEQYLRRIEGLIVGEDPRQGFTRNGTFYHPELRFQMPLAAGWDFENQPTAVVLAEPNGRAMMGLRMAPGARPRDAAAQFVNENKIQVVASGDTQVNGLPTSVIIGRAATEQGEVGVWNAFIEMSGKVYSILGYAPAEVFEQMRPTFERVAAGFGPLHDPNLLNVQPARLRVVRADRTAPFASFLPTSLPPSLTAESVAIMNQVSLNQNVPQGRFIKVPDATAYQQTTSNIPATNQPAQYPQNYPNQPYPTYPPQQPQPYPTYPPQQSQPYPTYPPQQYPQNYPPTQPGQTYPQYPTYPQQNPPQQPYPQYPQQYPQQQYPQQQGYPQFPQPNQPQQPQPQQQPGWPR